MPVVDEQGQPAGTTPLSDVLRDLLVCPVDHKDLRLEDLVLVCTSCGRRYPVDDGIPNMLVPDVA